MRAKRALDRLAILTAGRARAVRDGAVTEIPLDRIVLDDVLELGRGDQVPVDGTVQARRFSLVTGRAGAPVAEVIGALAATDEAPNETGRLLSARYPAAASVRYLLEKGITIKVLSGDAPRAVAAIAGQAGIPAGGGGRRARCRASHRHCRENHPTACRGRLAAGTMGA